MRSTLANLDGSGAMAVNAPAKYEDGCFDFNSIRRKSSSVGPKEHGVKLLNYSSRRNWGGVIGGNSS